MGDQARFGYEIRYGKARVPLYRVYGRPLTGLAPIPESSFIGRSNVLVGAEIDIEVFTQDVLPAYTEGLGAKGCVVFAPERIYEYRDYLTKVNVDLSTLAWLFHMNHGIFMTPGVEEEWTLSIAHTDEHIDRYVEAFEAFASAVT